MDKYLASRRDRAVDLAKASAICAVVLIHCSASHFARYEVRAFQWMATCFWGCVSRWAVAVFVLCSGTLMNAPERELPLSKLFSRYLLRLVLALSAWAALYELVLVYVGWGSAPLKQLLLQGVNHWLTGKTYYHLYYFYYAIALYLSLPMTRLIAKHASKTELRYILILWLVAGSILPFLQFQPFFIQMDSVLSRYIIPSAVLVPGVGLLGWYLYQYPVKSQLGWLTMYLAGFGMTFLNTWWRSKAVNTLDSTYLSGFSPFVLLMAVGVFQLCRRWAGQGLPRGVSYLAQGSFCVYLIHPIFHGMTTRIFSALPPVWGIPVQVVLLLALSAAAYEILRRVPVVNRWLI